MSKICWVWTMVLVAAALMVIPSAGAETTEREWWELGKDYVFTGSENAYYGNYLYIRANNSDVLTVNWKSGNLTSYPPYLYIYIYARDVVNYSGLKCKLPSTHPDGFDGGYYLFIRNSSAPPQTGWLRLGSDQIMKVEWYGFGSLNVTVNITLTPGEETLASKVGELNASFDRLLGNLTALEYAVSELSGNLSAMESSVGDLRALVVSLRESILGLNESFSEMVAEFMVNQSEQYESVVELQSLLRGLSESVDAIQAELEGVWCNGTGSHQSIQGQLAVLNDSLMRAIETLRGAAGYNDTALWESLAEARGRLELEPYNDSTLWQELERLKGNVSMVCHTVVNNTTVQQPVMYVNRTAISEPDSSGVLGGVTAGAVSGVVATAAATALYDRRIRRRYGGMVEPPATEKI